MEDDSPVVDLSVRYCVDVKIVHFGSTDVFFLAGKRRIASNRSSSIWLICLRTCPSTAAISALRHLLTERVSVATASAAPHSVLFLSRLIYSLLLLLFIIDPAEPQAKIPGQKMKFRYLVLCRCVTSVLITTSFTGDAYRETERARRQ